MDEDDRVWMYAFVNGKDTPTTAKVLKNKAKTSRATMADNTAEMTKAYLADKRKNAEEKRRADLLDLTRRNLDAADAARLHEREIAAELEAQRPVTCTAKEWRALLEEGRRLAAANEIDQAKAFFVKCFSLLRTMAAEERASVLADWIDNLVLSYATCLVQMQRYADAVAVLAGHLRRSATVASTERMLRVLSKAHEAVGQSYEASVCRTALQSDLSVFDVEAFLNAVETPDPSFSTLLANNASANAEATESFAASVQSGMDEAIESALLRDDFDDLDTTFEAYELAGLDADTVRRVANLGHSKTNITPLHASCARGNVEMAVRLLSKGAWLSSADYKGKNCIDYCVDFNRPDVLRAVYDSSSSEARKKIVEAVAASPVTNDATALRLDA